MRATIRVTKAVGGGEVKDVRFTLLGLAYQLEYWPSGSRYLYKAKRSNSVNMVMIECAVVI